jgi:hypothetical protein
LPAPSREQKRIRVRGTIDDARWDSHDQWLEGAFRDAPDVGFFVYKSRRVALEIKLGGNLQEVLPGAYVEFNTYPQFVSGRLNVVLDGVENIVEYRPATTRPATTTIALDRDVVAADDLVRLERLIGRKVNVQGAVVRSDWSGSGKVLNVEFAGPSETKLQAYLFSSRREAFEYRVRRRRGGRFPPANDPRQRDAAAVRRGHRKLAEPIADPARPAGAGHHHARRASSHIAADDDDAPRGACHHHAGFIDDPRRGRRLEPPLARDSVLSIAFSSSSHTRSIWSRVMRLKNGRPSVRALDVFRHREIAGLVAEGCVM